MNELAPGVRLEVLKDQRLGGGYAHADGILAALKRAEEREKPQNEHRAPSTPKR